MIRVNKPGLLGFALCAWLSATPAFATDTDPLALLQRLWWQWVGSFPLNASPLIDETGEFCAAGQRGGIWYLVSNAGGTTTRSCRVPRGVKLLVPTVTAFCYPEEGFDTDETCIQFINDALAGYRPADLVVKLDGVKQPVRDVCEVAAAPGDKLPPIAKHCVVHRRADRTLWKFTIEPNTIYASEPGVWRANGARGAFALIDTSGLKLGEHVIKIRATGQPGALIPFMSVTYHLTVGKPVN